MLSAAVVIGASRVKTNGFPFQNNPTNLDPSYNMELDFWVYKMDLHVYTWDCFRRGKAFLKTEFHKTDLNVWSHSAAEK